MNMKRAAAPILLLALAVSPAHAANTAHDWRVIDSEEFRQGFVAGIASYLLDVAGGGPERAGYAECLAGRTDRSLLAAVDDYMDRHPESGGYAPAAAAMLALGELCAANMPRQPQMPP
jgi:hypothetical protein